MRTKLADDAEHAGGPRKITRTGVGAGVSSGRRDSLGVAAVARRRTRGGRAAAQAGHGGGHPEHHQAVLREHDRAVHRQGDADVPLHADQRQGHDASISCPTARSPRRSTCPASNGQVADVVLGFKTLADYVANDSPPVTANGGPYFGETIGRYANRIAKGTFQLERRRPTRCRSTTAPNACTAASSGSATTSGPRSAASSRPARSASRSGSSARTATPPARPAAPAARARCTGYPAQLTVDVTFTLNNQGQYGIHYKAHNDDAKLSTVLNLTNHSYFNLAGENSAAGSAYSQICRSTPTTTRRPTARRSRCRCPTASRSRARRSTSARRTPSARGSAT